eukprot:10233723-Lingulodinium_polyedra.AAC.1
MSPAARRQLAGSAPAGHMDSNADISNSPGTRRQFASSLPAARQPASCWRVGSASPASQQ